MSPTYLTHGKCGKRYIQRGERTSHCGGCHETFATMTAFERHRRENQCLNPATAEKPDGTPVFTTDSDGYWTPVLSDTERRRLQTWLDQRRGTRTSAEQAEPVPEPHQRDSVPSDPRTRDPEVDR